MAPTASVFSFFFDPHPVRADLPPLTPLPQDMQSTRQVLTEACGFVTIVGEFSQSRECPLVQWGCSASLAASLRAAGSCPPPAEALDASSRGGCSANAPLPLLCRTKTSDPPHSLCASPPFFNSHSPLCAATGGTFLLHTTRDMDVDARDIVRLTLSTRGGGGEDRGATSLVHKDREKTAALGRLV